MSLSTSSPARSWGRNDQIGKDGNGLPGGSAGRALVSGHRARADHLASGADAEDQRGAGQGSRPQGRAWPRDVGRHREKARQARLCRRERARRRRREGCVDRSRHRPRAGNGGLMKKTIANRAGPSRVLATLLMLLVPSIVLAHGPPRLGTEEFGLSQRELVQAIERTEELIAKCMREQGFQYIAVDHATVRAGMAADKALPGGSAAEFD